MSQCQIIPSILDQHCEEASFLWILRRALLRRADSTLPDLCGFDERIDAHVAGIRIAGERGWTACKEWLVAGGSGEVFTATVLALEFGDKDCLTLMIGIAEANSCAWQGFASAFGWVSPKDLRGIVKTFLAAELSFLRRIGITACAIQRADPGAALVKALADVEPQLRARAFRAAGELGRLDLLATCLDGLQDADIGARFRAAWSAVLLGDRETAVKVLQSYVLVPNAFRVRALCLLLKVIDLPSARRLLRTIAQDPANNRLLIQGAGISGDPQYLPWLIKQMETPKLARLAGESFSMITGRDLVALNLERKPPEDFEAGPTANPEDENVDTDPDDSLPWPDVPKIQQWWAANAAAFSSGVRIFMGTPVTREHCLQVLKDGFQRQRIAAAEYLCLLNPGTPLFNTRAPAWRQQHRLAAMR